MHKRYSSIEIFYGILFFVVHICIEVISYMLLYLKFSTFVALSIILLYDYFAFVPQLIIGNWHNKHKTINIGYIGLIFFNVSIVLINTTNNVVYILAVLLLSFGNAILHECGAIAVASVSKKNIFPSALFVSGGTIGIVIGTYLARIHASVNVLFIFVAIILIILALTDKTWCKENVSYIDVNVVNFNYRPVMILIVAFVVVMLRSYMGFVAPITWKETFFHTVILSLSLGIGKALGGYLCDVTSYRIVGFISTLLCIPFIIFGSSNMFLSLLGLLLFSMTMSITYAMALSVIKNNPGVAFGVTTIGLFAGAAPLFFFKLSLHVNVLIIIFMSLLCFFLLQMTLKKDLYGRAMRARSIGG